MFATLKAALVPLIAEVGSAENDDFLRGPFAEDRQHAVSLHVIERFGYTPERFRLDRTVHPSRRAPAATTSA